MTRTIKSACVKAAAIAMAAFAASAILTVHANTTRNWIGGTGTADAPMNIWDYANWNGEGNFGTGNTVDCFLSVTDKTYLNSANSSRLCCDLVPNAGDFVFTGPLQFYSFKPGSVANSTVSIVKKSGDWTIATYGMYIGNASGTKATFVNESGNITSTSSTGVHLGCIAGATGIVENVSGDWTIDGRLTVGEASGGVGSFTIKGGSVSSGGMDIANNGATGTVTVIGGNLSINGSLYVIRDNKDNSGTLTIKGGTVTVPTSTYTIFSQGYGSINLDGGTLVTKQINRWGNNDTRVQRINFNGGTLKANAAGSLIYAQYGYLYVTVNAGGGTIDCNGNAITIDQGPRYNDFRGVGGLTFTGGNTITISNNVTYSGTTYVAADTTLKLTKASASSILSNGMVFIGAPVVGTAYTVLTSSAEEDDWSDLDLTNVKCPVATSFTPALGADGKSITVTVTARKSGYWTGAAGDNNLSTAGNWSDGNVPSGSAVIFSSVSTKLTRGATFAPTSITFDAGSAPVTIDGDFTTLTSVTNNSSVNQTFAGFVDFGAGNIDVTATAELSGTEPNQTVVGGCVVFKGGVRGAKVVNHSIVAGKYTLTTDEAFIAINTTDRFTINEDSSLSVKSADNTCALYIREGATFNVENSVRSSAVNGVEANNCLWSWSKGAYVVSDFTLVAANPSRECWLGGHTFSSAYGAANAGAVLKIGTLTLDSDKFCALHGTGANSGSSTPTIFIGEGGLNIASGKAGYYAARSDIHKTTLRPWNSDFTFGGGSTKDYDFLLGEGVNPEHMGNIKFTLNTDDEAGVPRTIKMAARICTSSNTSSITVAGHGTNIVTSASPLMTGTYAVTNAATVVLKNGAAFTNGTVSVGSTATLAIGESGTFKSGNLTLADGATLGFNYTGRSAPVLNLDGKTVTFAEGATTNVTVKVSAAEGKRARGGVNVLTTGGKFAGVNVELAAGKPDWALGVRVNGDGNIVLDAKPRDFIISFK